MRIASLLVAVLVISAMSFVACGEGGGGTDHKAVYTEYTDAVIENAKDPQEDFDPTALADEIAEKHGFESWQDYNTKAAEAMGAEEWSEFVQAETERATKAAEEAAQAAMDEAAGAGDDEGDDAGSDDE